MNASDDGNNHNTSNNNNNNNENEQRRKGKGRQKITMAKIENETNLQVTFSKRRAGVFKKASELSTLCGAESAVVVFSPGNKPHSFGHPNVETVANRFLHASNSDGNPRTNAADQLIMAHGEAAMHQRNHELVAIEAQLEREKQRKKELDDLAKANQGAPPLDELDYEQLDRVQKSVMSFKREFEAKVKNNAAGNSSWNNASSHHHGLGFPVYGYGGTNIIPTISGGPSFAYPVGSSLGNYGYTVQYPPVGPSGSDYNYGGNPAAVVQYDAGTGSSDADPDATPQATRDCDIGFRNYRRSS